MIPISPTRIDLHAHYLPDDYRSAAEEAGHEKPDGFPQLPGWSADEHVAMMDRLGIAISFLSISSPGVSFGSQVAARHLARSVNESGKLAVEQHPDRLRLFASLPLPECGDAIQEINHCYDVLDVDGVVLLTNVNGIYLGDPALESVFDELDQRHARVFVHPTSPACWEHTSFDRPRPMLEFLFDTTRAVVNMVLNGTIARHPNIQFIIPHAGATLPVVADRIAAFSLILPDIASEVDVQRDLARLHYDLAGFPIPRQLAVLLTSTTIDHLHFGSDYPFTPELVVAMLADPLRQAGEPAGSLLTTLRENSLKLFPRLADIPHSTRILPD